jgi:hypothetical protein
MKRTIRLTESELISVIKKVISEQNIIKEDTSIEQSIDSVDPRDPKIEKLIADWVMTFGSVEELEYYIKQNAREGQTPLFLQKIMSFLEKTPEEKRRKQINQATRSYNLQQASDSPVGKVAKTIGSLTFDALWLMLANKIRKGLQNKKEQ